MTSLHTVTHSRTTDQADTAITSPLAQLGLPVQVVDWLCATDFDEWAEVFWEWVQLYGCDSMAVAALEEVAPHLLPAVVQSHFHVRAQARRLTFSVLPRRMSDVLLPYICDAFAAACPVPGQLRTLMRHHKKILRLLQVAAASPAVTSVRAKVWLRQQQRRQQEAAVLRRLMPAADVAHSAPELQLHYVDEQMHLHDGETKMAYRRQRLHPHVARMCWHFEMVAPRLRALHLDNLQLRDAEVEQLAPALQQLRALTSFELSDDTGTCFDSVGYYALAWAVQPLQQLARVKIYLVSYSTWPPLSTAVYALERVICSLPRLQEATLLPTLQRLQPRHQHTLQMLADCSKLSRLALYRWAFPAVQAVEASVFSKLTSLQQLTLACKGLSRGAAQPLCTSLASLPALSELSLNTSDGWSIEQNSSARCNDMPCQHHCGRCGQPAVAPLLALPQLLRLRLSGGMRQLPPLLPCLQCCTKLQLYAQAGTLGQWQTRVQQVLHVAAAVRLTSLQLSHMQMAADDLLACMSARESFESLQHLHIGYASLSVGAMKSDVLSDALVALLKVCTKLQHLSIEDGPLSASVEGKLREQLAFMSQLRIVSVMRKHLNAIEGDESHRTAWRVTINKMPECTLDVRDAFTDIMDVDWPEVGVN